MLEKNCTTEQKIKVKLNPITAAGNPTDVETLSVTIQSGDGSFEFIADEPNNFWAISGSEIMDTTFLISADADLGPGTETISDLFILHVGHPKAASLGLTAEEPVLK